MPNEPIELEPAKPRRRRRYTAEQKRALLDEAAKPTGSIPETARRYGVAPSTLLQWKRVMDDATKKSLKANEQVVPKSELKQAETRIRELKRTLREKTMEAEILKQALAIAKEKSGSRAATRASKANHWGKRGRRRARWGSRASLGGWRCGFDHIGVTSGGVGSRRSEWIGEKRTAWGG